MYNTTYRRIDLQNLKEDTFGDTTILRMVIELFIEEIDEFLVTLKNELPNKNWPVLFQATHKIKPNITMFGIFSLELSILEMETYFRNEENLNTIDELVNTSIPVFDDVKIELQTELKLMNNE